MPKKVEEVKTNKQDDLLDKLTYPGAERICVGAPLLNDELFYEFGDDFPEEAFTDKYWRALFRMQRSLHAKGFKVDKNTVINTAEKYPEFAKMLEEAGGIKYLDRAIAIPDTKNFSNYIKIVIDAHDKRLVIREKQSELDDLKKIALDEAVTAKNLVQSIDQSSAEIAAKIHKVDDYKIVTINYDKFLKESIAAKEQGKDFHGILTNMKAWDDMLYGLVNGRLYVMGAPTGCGKSLFMISMLISSAYGVLPGDSTSRHLVIETGELLYQEDFLSRLLSNMSGVNEHKISKNYWHENELDRARIMAAANKLENDPRIFFHQMPDFDAKSVYNLIRRMRHKEGIDCVWFDNIKINPNWKTSEAYNKIGDLAQGLKEAARDMNIPVFAMIQLTNDGTAVGKKKIGMDIHVDMFAGGRRVLQNTDVGLVMDYFDTDNPFNDDRKIIVGKSRFTRWHRKGEYFNVLGNMDNCRLFIDENVRVTSNSQPITNTGDNSIGLANLIPGKIIKPVDDEPDIDINDIPDFI